MLHNVYISYLRRRIRNATTIHQLINVFKNITFFHPSIDADGILTILSECFIIDPPNDVELQRFSTFQKEHEYNLGIESYVSFIIWISTINTINRSTKRTSTRDYCLNFN
jgi:hypothetical protein